MSSLEGPVRPVFILCSLGFFIVGCGSVIAMVIAVKLSVVILRSSSEVGWDHGLEQGTDHGGKNVDRETKK